MNETKVEEIRLHQPRIVLGHYWLRRHSRIPRSGVKFSQG